MSTLKKNKSTGEQLYIIFHQVLFILTGLAATLGCQWLFYHGAATGDSYMTQLAQYVGTIFVGLLIPTMLKRQAAEYAKLPTQQDSINMEIFDNGATDQHDESIGNCVEGPIEHSTVFKLSLLDVFANFCVTIGFSIVGSGMFQVIYSSVVIWCAILTYFLMGRTLTRIQWLAIFGTSAGLAICSLGSMGNASDDDSTGLLMLGTLLTLGGTIFYSCVYVYSDYLLSKQSPPPLPARFCCYLGMYSTVISLIWISVYTMPRYDELLQIKNTTKETVWAMYLLVTISSGVHSWNYYELIHSTGSVATGILQGLRAVIVYVLSHAWYCSSDSAQCFTVYKGCGSFIVITCVLLFTTGGGLSK